MEVSIWEAPPATLFAASGLDPRAPNAGSRVVTIPEQMIDADGMINIPFVGAIKVSGRSQASIENEIVQRLRGQAHKPHALVRVTRNVTRNVTVVGEVAQSLRMPLTAKGERLLDALAAAGGARQPVAKMTLQITRDTRVVSLPLDTIITDPQQNIALRPGDVITAIHQPFSLTVLGATSQNTELNFETQGISLTQAIARVGGLQDTRADPRGVFIFRAEASKPVVYRLDLTQPGAFLIAQSFPMRHRDVMYVANAPAAELQKFLNLIGSTIIPVAAVRTLAP
jgi:polysaccharide export outer membrane protein